MEPLDKYTHRRLTTAINDATSLGQDIPEYLHRYGFIASRHLRDRWRADAIRDLKDRLRQLDAVMPPSFWRALEDWEQEARQGKWR